MGTAAKRRAMRGTRDVGRGGGGGERGEADGLLHCERANALSQAGSSGTNPPPLQAMTP